VNAEIESFDWLKFLTRTKALEPNSKRFLNLKNVSKWLKFSAYKFERRFNQERHSFHLAVAFADPLALRRIIAQLCGAAKLPGGGRRFTTVEELVSLGLCQLTGGLWSVPFPM